MEKILTVDQVDHLSKALKTKNQTIVLVGGCFDILHVGHISLLEHAKQKADVLVLLLESDASITKHKGAGRPLHTQEQRAKVLTALRFVDYVILLPDDISNNFYDHLVKALQPDIIATTENDSGLMHKKRQAEMTGAQLVIVNKLIQNVSTSRIVSALHNEL
jgi:rfaE bifunctional protein nucleotidyltransferase chain/domain